MENTSFNNKLFFISFNKVSMKEGDYSLDNTHNAIDDLEDISSSGMITTHGKDDKVLNKQQQLHKPSPSVSPVPSPSLSHGKRPILEQAQLVEASALASTGTELDNFELIGCTVNRRDNYPGIGLSLSTAINHPNRSVSRSSVSKEDHQQESSSSGQSQENLPIITNVDVDSPAEQSGLRVGDLVLEINGKSTHRQTNSNIAKWIRSGGNTIEFVVSRTKQQQTSPQINTNQYEDQDEDEQMKENAKRIAEDALQVAKHKVAVTNSLTSSPPDYLYHKEVPNENLHNIIVEAINSSKVQHPSPSLSQQQQQHISRKDSVRLSANSIKQQYYDVSPPSVSTSPIQSEIIKMSSSKLHQDPTNNLASQQQQQEQRYSPSLNVKTASSSSTSLRNQSEPAPLKTTTAIASSSSSSLVVQQQQQQTAAAQSGLESSSSSSFITPTPTQGQITKNVTKQRSQSSFTLPRDAPIPRLCRVRAYEEQLGFTVAGSKANRGVFKVNDVSPNSPAAHSGLQNEDYIIEISGVNVESMSYVEVVDFIKSKKAQDDLQLLVADRLTIQWYRNQKIPIASQLVPKMQYIETLLHEDIPADQNENENENDNQDNNSDNISNHESQQNFHNSECK